MPENLKPQDILRGAADLIERCGQVKSAYFDPVSGGYCALGALAQAAFGTVHIPVDDYLRPSYAAYVAAKGALVRRIGEGVIPWNYGVDGAEVSRAMRAVADALDARESGDQPCS